METTDSLFLSLNFEGEAIPEKIEIIPAGVSIMGRDGRVFKNTDPKKIAANSVLRLPALPIDENHSTDLAAPKGGASPAFGWMKNLCADTKGAVWADVEWTLRGREALLKKEYKYISPVFLTEKNGEINCVLRAALTNSPNLQLPALNAEKNNTEDSMNKELCAALGLPETATEAEVIAAAKALKREPNAAQGSSVDLQVYAPRTDLNAAVERAEKAEKRIAELNASKLKSDAESAVDTAIKAGKFPPASKEFYIEMCATQDGLEKFRKYAETAPVVMNGQAQAPEGMPPEGSVSLNSEEAAVAKAMGYTEDEYKKIKEAGK